ncbi:MAG: FtsQ-type POTRA domain-containing protein [Candidatus Eisenbacteria bacterium]
MNRRARFWLRLGAGAAVLFVVAALSFGLERARVYATADGRFPVAEIRVEGNRLLYEGEVIEWAGVERGENLIALDPGEVEARLEESPWIRSAEVRRRPPGRVQVRVEERRPWLLAAAGESPEMVDREGVRFPAMGKDQCLDLPLLAGGAPEDVARLAAAFPEDRDWISERAAQVTIDEDGSITLVEASRGTRIRLGREYLPARAERLRLVMKTWEATGEHYREIDFRYGDQAVARGKAEKKGQGT